MKIVYSQACDFGWPGLQWVHPFDGQKFSRAMAVLERGFGAGLAPHIVDPAPWLEQVAALLPEVHTSAYLESLKQPKTIAEIIEVAPLGWLPIGMLESGILAPMRMGCAGTCAAAELALEHGLAINFGGGFHHAHADHGEGFCLLNDVALAHAHLLRLGRIGRQDPVWIIDLDAHRGNGNEEIYRDNRNVHFLDVYNRENYPGPLVDNVRFPHLHGWLEHMGVSPEGRPDASTDAYLGGLKKALGEFIDSTSRPQIAFYNAGTDIVMGDELGRLSISEAGVLVRDRLVIRTLRDLGIPTAMVTSGGYTDKSHQLIAMTVAWALATYAGATPQS
jgi:histone deacetylase 11